MKANPFLVRHDADLLWVNVLTAHPALLTSTAIGRGRLEVDKIW